MPRETFELELHKLQDETLILGDMVEQAVREAVQALLRRDQADARRIYADDRLVNEKRYAIEQECLAVIATQQPMARDLRLLAAILEIITELERIGDYAKGICHITLLLGNEPLVKPLIDIPRMSEIGLDMLHRALSAFIARDAEAARAIPEEDNKVDALYNKVYHDLIELMIANPSLVDRANLLMWAAHNLERLADRVTNICERTVFVVSGENIEIDQSFEPNSRP
jgi:phosphate transport system protein